MTSLAIHNDMNRHMHVLTFLMCMVSDLQKAMMVQNGMQCGWPSLQRVVKLLTRLAKLFLSISKNFDI